MFCITVAGLMLMAVGYLLLGPAPPLQTLLLGGGRAPWLIWVSLSVAGIGAGMAFVPLLPAMLTSLAAVCHQTLGSILSESTPKAYISCCRSPQELIGRTKPV